MPTVDNDTLGAAYPAMATASGRLPNVDEGAAAQEWLSEQFHGAALGSWAQNFPLATSRRASFSSSDSASSRLRRAFCSRSSLSSLAASVSIPP